jgi:uncharacterized protein YprB with RNaseH-like and TPR domain
MDAILLWMEWKNYQNKRALDILIHYCCADVLSLQLLAGKILEKHKMSVNYPSPEEIWLKLE